MNYYFGYFCFLTTLFKKSRWFWKMDILKMSKIEKPKKVLKKTLKIASCDDNAVIFYFLR